MSEPENYVAWLRYVTAGENTKIITCDSNAPGAFRVYRAQDDIYHSCGKHGTIWTGAAMCPDCQAEVDANVAERLAGMRAYFYGIVLGEVASSTGPTGGWLDSPKGVLAAIREALGKNESADAGVRAIEERAQVELLRPLGIERIDEDSEVQWEVPAEPEPLYFDTPQKALANFHALLDKEIQDIERRVLEKAAGHMPYIKNVRSEQWRIACSCGGFVEDDEYPCGPQWQEHIFALQDKEQPPGPPNIIPRKRGPERA